jgi:adenosylcobinamide-GDP ribazoletransferase
MVDGLRRAFGFLTVYPLRASDTWTPETLGSSMVYYPLVGTFIGLALWGLAVLLSVLFPPSIVSVLLLAGSLLVTGGLHIDGLADTVDGLSGSYNREDALRIFKDPHVGSMAVAGVVVVLLVKYACFNALSHEALLPSLVAMATLSRYAMVQMACFSPYARPTGGLGEPFVRGIRQEHHLVALCLALGSVLLFGGLRGVCIGVLVGLATLGLQVYFRQRLGGITGDVLGATNELNEALVLLLATMVF